MADNAVIRTQQRQYDNRNYDVREEVRHNHGRLEHAGEFLAVNLAGSDGQYRRDYAANYKEDDIIEQGVLQNRPERIVLEHELEVLETYPRAAEYAVLGLEVLKRKHSTNHRHVAEAEDEYKARYTHHQQWDVCRHNQFPVCLFRWFAVVYYLGHAPVLLLSTRICQRFLPLHNLLALCRKTV